MSMLKARGLLYGCVLLAPLLAGADGGCSGGKVAIGGEAGASGRAGGPTGISGQAGTSGSYGGGPGSGSKGKPDDGASLGPGGASGSSGKAGSGWQTPECARGAGVYRPLERTEFVDTIIGAWVLCSAESPLGPDAGESGILLDADGTWFMLFQDESGVLLPASGFDREGTWDVIDTASFNGPGSFQLNLSIFGRGTVISHPEFTAQPVTMRINNNGVYEGDYQKLD